MCEEVCVVRTPSDVPPASRASRRNFIRLFIMRPPCSWPRYMSLGESELGRHLVDNGNDFFSFSAHSSCHVTRFCDVRLCVQPFLYVLVAGSVSRGCPRKYRYLINDTSNFHQIFCTC